MGGKKTVEPGVTEDVCCPFEEVQVLTMMIQNPGSAAPQPPKRLDEGTVLQADSDCIYIGGKYKLPWKKVTHLQIIVAADSGGDACFHVSTVPVDEGNVPTGKGYKVAARLGTDPRTGRPPLQQWAAFSRFVEKKWNKKQRRLARKEAEALEEERQQQQTKTMTSRSRSYKPSRSKASKFLAKNAKNIKDWDSDDDEVFNRQPHRELLSAKKKRRQLQEEEEAKDYPVDMDDDEEDDGEHQATFDNSEEMPPSSDLDGEVEAHKAAQAKKQKPRRLKRKRRDDDDSDDENLFDDSAPDLTTPMAKRVVTPGTTSFRKSVLDDDDDDENDGEQEMDEETKNSSVAKTKSKTSKKGPGSITSFFAPRAKPAATQRQDRKEQNKGESPGKSEKEQESEVPAPQKKAESSKDFFAPRRSTVVANTSESKDQASDPQDEDDATVGSTPPTEVPTQYYDSGDEELDRKDNTQTPLKNVSSQKKPFSSSSRFAYESAKKLEQDDDPIMEFDTDLVSPSKKSSTALVVGTSPLASRLSGQKRRLFPRKGYYGSKPPTKTATLALEMADHQSPRRNPFAGMGPISSSTKKTTKPVGSPLSPIRARPPLPSSPKSPIQSVPPPPKWVGLRNLGNTCYINASLQMLYSVPSFVGNLFPFRPGHRLVSSFCATYQNVIHPKEGKEGSATARGLKMAMDAKTNKFLGYQQRDAHEFLGDLIDQMHEEIETHEETKEEEKKDDGPLSSPFPSSKGQVLPTDDFFRLDVEVCLKCKSCGYSRYELLVTQVYLHDRYFSSFSPPCNAVLPTAEPRKKCIGICRWISTRWKNPTIQADCLPNQP